MINQLKITTICLILFHISTSSTVLEIEKSSNLVIPSSGIQLFYISLENFPINANEGSILVACNDTNLNDKIELKSEFVNEIIEQSPSESNSLIFDRINQLYEIIYTFKGKKEKKKYFLFSIKNKGEIELVLTLTPLKFPQNFIVNSRKTQKLTFSYSGQFPTYYQINLEFDMDDINAILFCEEINFLNIKKEITQNSLDNAINKTVSVFEKNDNSNNILIVKIYNKGKDGNFNFYFEFTNKKVVYLQNQLNKYYQTEFSPLDKNDIYIINADDIIINKLILFKQIFGDSFSTFYSSSAKIENEKFKILPSNQDKDNIIENNKYISFNSKFQILLIQHKNYGKAKYIFINREITAIQNSGEDFFFFTKGQSKTLTIPSSKGVNFRILHLYGGTLSYKMDKYNLVYEEDSHGYYESSGNLKFVIKANDESIIQVTFVLGKIFKTITKSSTIFNNYGILILLKQDINYSTYNITINAKIDDPNKDIELLYSSGIVKEEKTAPFPMYAGNSKSAKNKIEIYGINPYFFSNYNLKEDKFYYSLCNANLTNTTYDIIIKYNQKPNDTNGTIIQNNILNKLEKNIYYNLEGGNHNNSYITYMLYSCLNTRKTLSFNYYDIKMDIYTYESFLNLKQIPLYYQNSTIFLENEKKDDTTLFYFHFNNESVNQDLLDNFSKKANNLKLNYSFNDNILSWTEPLENFEYSNMTIYIYENKQFYNLCNFTDEAKLKAKAYAIIEKKILSHNFNDLLLGKDYEFYILFEYNIESIPIYLLTSFTKRFENANNKTLKTILIISIPLAVVFIIVIIIIICCIRKSKKKLDLKEDPLMSMHEIRE